MDRISCQLIGALCLSALEELAMQNQRLQKWRSNIFEERVWKKIATNVKSYLIYVVQKLSKNNNNPPIQYSAGLRIKNRPVRFGGVCF